MGALRGFKPLGKAARRVPAMPDFGVPRGLKYSTPRTLDYARIKEEVMAAILQLPMDKQRLIPASGTLPEQMVALALCWLGIPFSCQRSEDGGKLRLGGSVVDLVVFLGGTTIAVRVMGDYWHSLPGRKRADIVQLERLRSKGYRTADIWEHDCYQTWVAGNFKSFIEDSINNAA